MPHGFTEQERDVIRTHLLEHAQTFLGSYGMRKTTVEDLTNAASIAKGSFYAFFPSKEDLFFTLFEQLEADYRRELLTIAGQQLGTPRERVKAVLQQAATLWRTSPRFKYFGQEEYELLARKLPAERLAAHQRDSALFGANLLAKWRERGLVLSCPPADLIGLLRALFFISLHADDFGPTSYNKTIGLLIELVTAYLVRI